MKKRCLASLVVLLVSPVCVFGHSVPRSGGYVGPTIWRSGESVSHGFGPFASSFQRSEEARLLRALLAMATGHLPANEERGLIDELCRLGAALAADGAALEHELRAPSDHPTRRARAILQAIVRTIENAAVIASRVATDLEFRVTPTSATPEADLLDREIRSMPPRA